MNSRLRLSLALAAMAAAIMLLDTGCAVLARRQAENKIPRVNAKEYQVELNTIYGASVLIKETDIKWEGDVKNVGSSDVRVNTPFGGFHEKMETASFPKK